MHPAGADEWVRIVAVPTTLSAAEFTWWGGGLDPVQQTRKPYSHPYLVPQHIALDPEATRATPHELFLSSGMKAIDHAVERLATLRQDVLTELHSTRSLELLADGLVAVAGDADDMAARLRCLTGMALAMSSPASGGKVGASHALGHALGALNGVPHGLTSCVLLPAVLRWNQNINEHRQAAIAAALGRPDVCAVDALADLVATLGLPGRLRDIGVPRTDFDRLARRAFTDMAIVGSPRTPASARERHRMWARSQLAGVRPTPPQRQR